MSNHSLTICPADAMVCPDGSSVGRMGPNCEFASCPHPTSNVTAQDPRTILGNGSPEQIDVQDPKYWFTGNLIAGSPDSSPLIDFNSTDYNRAVTDKKIIVLYFYSETSPSSRIDHQTMAAVFNNLGRRDMVGFIVRMGQSATADDKELASEFDVHAPSTTVIVAVGRDSRDTDRIKIYTTPWDSETALLLALNRER